MHRSDRMRVPGVRRSGVRQFSEAQLPHRPQPLEEPAVDDRLLFFGNADGAVNGVANSDAVLGRHWKVTFAFDITCSTVTKCKPRFATITASNFDFVSSAFTVFLSIPTCAANVSNKSLPI